MFTSAHGVEEKTDVAHFDPTSSRQCGGWVYTVRWVLVLITSGVSFESIEAVHSSLACIVSRLIINY